MDQSELHALEARCVHDAPPPCSANCPLGVDVRGVLEAVAARRFDDGLQLLTARVLLPALLCRVCEEPCRSACTRNSTGGSLQVRAVEATCVAYGAHAKTRRVPPRRGTATVVGGGLAGMMAALDIALRGYRVRLLEAAGELGGRLRRDPRASSDAVDAAAARLERAGVRIELGRAVDAGALRALAGEAGVVCLACDVAAPPPGNRVVAAERVTAADRVVVAHAGRDTSYIAAAAAGRRAASAADLLLRGLPVPAAGAALRPALPAGFGARAPRKEAVIAADSSLGLDPAEATAEASRCLSCACRECMDACLFLDRSATSPKALLREINNNLVVTPGMGYRASKAVINACRLCGLCAEVCPADIDFGEVCRAARRGLHERSAMPPAVHEALLRDVVASNGLGFALARPQPGMAHSRFAFFPGCQLPASRPEPTRAAYEFLTDQLEGGVGLLLGCCGAPAAWAGRDDESGQALDAIGRAWEALARPTLIVACPSCIRALTEGRPDIPRASLWEVLARGTRGSSLSASGSGEARPWPPLAVHDPCAARHDEASRKAVRRLLEAAGCDHRDLPRSGRLAECCGFGGLQRVADPELAAAALASLIAADQREFVTTCAMCRDQFAAAGKAAWHMLDVLFGAPLPSEGQATGAERAAERGPSWSARRAARERFARELLRDLWYEDPRREIPQNEDLRDEVLRHEGLRDDRSRNGALGPERAAGPRIVIPASVRRALDEAFVYENDVLAVVAAAESEGPRFALHAGGRHLAARGRPGSVTYWVDYVRTSGGLAVSHVYSHRMQVLGVVTTAAAVAQLPSAGLADGVACEACGLDLAVRPVSLTYLGATFAVELPACPSCGAVFVSEEVAIGRMREVEMSLEDK